MAKIQNKQHNKAQGGNELMEDPAALREKIYDAEEYIKKKQSLILTVGAVIILIIGGVLGYRYYTQSQNQIAQAEMFQAVYYFEADSLQRALHGDGSNAGLLEIADEYGFTKAGNLAKFYIGASYLKLGEFENAIDHLNDFSASDIIVQARAYALLGDAYMELGNYSEAANFYQKAADHRTNQYFSPRYLMLAALAYENAGNIDKARKSYEEIITEFPTSTEFQNARKHKSRIEGIASK
jgi:tetratricopeptide (TPR) repeat protein